MMKMNAPRYPLYTNEASPESLCALDSGQRVFAAQVGDHAVYADGSTARIVTGAGKERSDMALVGSYPGSGDPIINTPQGVSLFMQRDGVPMEEDFLPTVEG